MAIERPLVAMPQVRLPTSYDITSRAEKRGCQYQLEFRQWVKGEWNEYVIRAIGGHIQIGINGTITADIRDDKRREGILAFQIHSGGPFEVAFKDVLLREITKEEE